MISPVIVRAALVCVLMIALVLSCLGQEKAVSLSAGPLISMQLQKFEKAEEAGTGIGFEVSGDKRLSKRSGIILQSTLTRNRYKTPDEYSGITSLFLKPGYKWHLHRQPIYFQALCGIETELNDGFTTISFTLGCGKEFRLRENIIMAGVDLIDGDNSRRIHLKAAFVLYRKIKV